VRPIVAPSTFRKRQRALDLLRVEYACLRRTALAVKAVWRATGLGKHLLQREEATGAALMARYEVKHAVASLARLGVQPGGRLSPRELARRASRRST